MHISQKQLVMAQYVGHGPLEEWGVRNSVMQLGNTTHLSER